MRKIALISFLGGAVPPALWVLYYRAVLDLEFYLPSLLSYLFLPGVLVGSLLLRAGAPPLLIESGGIIANGVAVMLLTIIVLVTVVVFRWIRALEDAAQ
jgi:hypothetical protein